MKTLFQGIILVLIIIPLWWILKYTICRHEVVVYCDAQEKCEELSTWTNENCRLYVPWIPFNLNFSILKFYFMYKEDAMAFKLRWL